MSIKHSLVAAAVSALLPLASQASSHREAPAITRMPAVDSTDFYLFNSYEPGRDGYVTVLANYIPLQQPYGGPNYFALDAGALYEIHIDNNGDVADDEGDGGVGAPAVELAGGIDLHQVAVADGALAGDAVDHLLVERDAGDGREGDAAGVALEQGDRPVGGVQRPIVGGVASGPGGLRGVRRSVGPAGTLGGRPGRRPGRVQVRVGGLAVGVAF